MKLTWQEVVLDLGTGILVLIAADRFAYYIAQLVLFFN